MLEQVLINSLVLSGTYILIASGLTLIFGILRVINFAHGALYMVGAYIVYTFLSLMGVNYFIATLIAIIATAMIGMAIEAGILHPLVDKPLLAGLGAILGVAFIVEGGARMIWGEENVAIQSPFSGVLHFLGATVSWERIAAVVLSAIIVIGLYYWIWHTKQGYIIRAVAENRQVASLQGVHERRIRLLVMAVASGVAAAAGAIMGPLFYVNPYMGGPAVFKGLLIIAIGGMGSINGSVLAGLIVGFVEGVGYSYWGPLTEIASFILVILIFVVRPHGLLGVPYEFH
jgi:branched-chain amino acid transport system permease protein